MLFSSIEFIFVFLPASLAFYFITPRKQKNLTLFIFSLIFYGWGEPRFLFLMLATITADFLFGILIDKKRSQAKLWLTLAVVSNLAVLAFFKYLSPTLNFLNIPFIDLALPVGISFYTFQSLSYVVDVYRGEAAQKSPVAFGTYITMFPQLVAGPIVKYGDISSQLNIRTVNAEKFEKGIRRFVLGLAKKIIFANSAGEMWSYFSELPRSQLSTLGAWLGILFYAFQIYFDFSGYSDMAIGMGHFFGFEFSENFNYPYTAKSIKDFWRRWHISLSTWFKEYLYIPLGGNRKGTRRTVLNMLIVWACTGIWHGAGLNFLVWGLYYFLLLTCEKLFWGKLLDKAPALIRHTYSLILILIGWVFFSARNLSDSFSYLSRMFSFSAPSTLEIYHFVRNIPFLLLLALGSTQLPKKAYEVITSGSSLRKFAISLGGLSVFILCVAELVSSSYNPFLYFRF